MPLKRDYKIPFLFAILTFFIAKKNWCSQNNVQTSWLIFYKQGICSTKISLISTNQFGEVTALQAKKSVFGCSYNIRKTTPSSIHSSKNKIPAELFGEILTTTTNEAAIFFYNEHFR